MRLEDISVGLRMRAQWEAVDLGVVMVREWWQPVYGAWWAVALPIAAAAHLLLHDTPWLAMLLIWWLKPLYDRFVLHALSQAVFGVRPTAGTTLRAWRSIVRGTGLLRGLTIGRLDLSRSFNLPVRQLEGGRGAAARERERTLGRRAGAHATNLLLVCIALETAALIALSGLVELVTPATRETGIGLGTLWQWVTGDDDLPLWAQLATSGLYLLAMSLIEPIYVASGFSLYLNRRTSLEAWDLELAFRRMAARHAGKTAEGARSAAAVMIAALVGLASLLPADPAEAAERDPAQVIREVLAHKDFGESRTEKQWRRIEPDKPEPGRDLGELARWLESLARALAELARIAAYAAIAAALFFAVRFMLRYVDLQRDRVPTPLPPPDVLFGLDVRPESLPANLAEVAARLAASDPVAALSLLYRGALVTLIHRDRLTLDPGDTEGDCLRQVERERAPALGAYFRHLVEAWSAGAYAHRPPAPDVIERLCREWPSHFAVVQART